MGPGLDGTCDANFIKERSKHRESNERRGGGHAGHGAQTLCPGEARHSYQNQLIWLEERLPCPRLVREMKEYRTGLSSWRRLGQLKAETRCLLANETLALKSRVKASALISVAIDGAAAEYPGYQSSVVEQIKIDLFRVLTIAPSLLVS